MESISRIREILSNIERGSGGGVSSDNRDLRRLENSYRRPDILETIEFDVESEEEEEEDALNLIGTDSFTETYGEYQRTIQRSLNIGKTSKNWTWRRNLYRALERTPPSRFSSSSNEFSNMIRKRRNIRLLSLPPEKTPDIHIMNSSSSSFSNETKKKEERKIFLSATNVTRSREEDDDPRTNRRRHASSLHKSLRKSPFTKKSSRAMFIRRAVAKNPLETILKDVLGKTEITRIRRVKSAPRSSKRWKLPSLRREYNNIALRDLPRTTRAETDLIENTMASLPVGYLREKNLLSQQARRACDVFQRAIERYIRMEETTAFETWRSYAEDRHLETCIKVASKIQTTWRRYTARCRYRDMLRDCVRIRRLAHVCIAVKKLEFGRLRVHSARVVQRRWRGHLGTQIVRKLRKERNACVRIQSIVRRNQAIIRVEIRRAQFRLETNAQITIACFWRRIRAFRRVDRIRRKIRVAKFHNMLGDKKWLRQNRRLRHGAALKIQNQWKSYRAHMWHFRGHEMADRISRAYRNYCGKRDTRSTITKMRQIRFQKLLKHRKATIERKRYDAASKIQSVFRAKRARVFVKELIVRKKEERRIRLEAKAAVRYIFFYSVTYFVHLTHLVTHSLTHSLIHRYRY